MERVVGLSVLPFDFDRCSPHALYVAQTYSVSIRRLCWLKEREETKKKLGQGVGSFTADFFASFPADGQLEAGPFK